MSKPSLVMLEVADKIYLMTTEGTWNLGSDAYTNSKERIMDWEGNII